MIDLSELTHGTDLAYDGDLFGLQDVLTASTDVDFAYSVGVQALKEEIERLFLTPKGSCVDDPTYGIDLNLVGTAITDLRVTIGMARVAVLDALEHPSFATRFRVASLDVDWAPSTPNALWIIGRLEVFNAGVLEFGPYSLELGQ